MGLQVLLLKPPQCGTIGNFLMTLRQQYAVAALQGILASGEAQNMASRTIAHIAFIYADDMLEIEADSPENFSEQKGE